jgi:hypothetical protein
MTNRDRQRLTLATQLASALHRATQCATTPTVDGRVLVYATQARGQQVLQQVRSKLYATTRTVRITATTDARLAILEVSGAS